MKLIAKILIGISAQVSLGQTRNNFGYLILFVYT